MAGTISGQIKRRRIIQWCLLIVIIPTVALGWKYPLLGFSVPIVMMMGIVGGFVRGRYVCGNLCPRGSFFDRVWRVASRTAPIPDAFRNRVFRWIFFAAMMVFMVYRLSSNPTDIRHWGHVFWLMCVITTGIGLVLGAFIHQRNWCAFCPIGTAASAACSSKTCLRIDAELCIDCRKCEKACPFGLAILVHKDSGVMSNSDCLKCSECIDVCPKDALSWPEKECD